MNLYYVTNGVILATEEADEREECWSFDAHKALIVQLQPRGGSQVNMAMAKASDSVGKPSVITGNRSAMIMVTDVGDANLVQQMKAALAGLVIPGGNGRNLS